MPNHGHSVQFYSREELLREAGAKFLASALKQGQGVIAIATRQNRVHLAATLAAAIELEQARNEGRYIEVDAEDFANLLTVAGHPDRERFVRLMGTLVVRASRAGAGEPAIFDVGISTLCARGQIEAAIEMEHLWNELSRQHSFSILCAYATAPFAHQEQREAFQRICAAHSSVLPEEEFLQLSDRDRLRYVAQLQQRVRALDSEIAERQHSEEALARSEKLAEMGRLAATIAHEINSPLTSLTNIIYLLSTHRSLDSGARQYIAMADQELRRTARITRQVLGFYRESHNAVRCELSEIMDGVLELYQPKLTQRNIEVAKDYRIEGPINGYPSEMRQVFANLIGNAIEAMDHNGRLRVRISRSCDWKQLSRSTVRVSIADSGPGISTKNRKFLFHPFFTTKGESGTGLGLWLSRGIVHRHHGRLRLRTSAEKDRHGTVFSIVLPAWGQASEPQLTPSAPWKIAA